MTPAFYAIAAIIVGFVLLTVSADRFVSGAAATAKNWGISPMLIGLTVVAIGTSAPEILVSMISAMQGFPDMSVGNAIGSNITNIGLVLGITALIAPLPIKPALAKREIPWLIFVSLVAGGCLYDGELGVLEGGILLLGTALTIYLMIRWQKAHPEEVEEEEIEALPTVRAYVELIVGLIFLLISSQILVYGATTLAELFGVSELVIGLTVVAIGTSLPELAASVMSAIRGHHDIAIGNVVGSNIFNLLAVLSMPGLVAPGTLNASIMDRDYPVMLALVAVVGLVAHVGKQPRRLGRTIGVLLLLSYIFYCYWLYMQAS